ncbi:hypothetical protein B0O99DRAFT_721779, partial [Bisporella sp. PMI_857]
SILLFQPPTSDLQPPNSKLQLPTSNFHPPSSILHFPTFNLQYPTFNFIIAYIPPRTTSARYIYGNSNESDGSRSQHFYLSPPT